MPQVSLAKPVKVVNETHIIGIDPALGTTGYGVVAVSRGTVRLIEAGVIRCSRAGTLENRLLELYEGMVDLLKCHPTGSVAIEQLYTHYERPTTAILMGHARGVISLAVAQAGLQVHSYLPTKVKKMLTGNGRAPKDQMQMAVAHQLRLPAPPEPADVADALAIAICHYHCTFGPLSTINKNAS